MKRPVNLKKILLIKLLLLFSIESLAENIELFESYRPQCENYNQIKITNSNDCKSQIESLRAIELPMKGTTKVALGVAVATGAALGKLGYDLNKLDKIKDEMRLLDKSLGERISHQSVTEPTREAAKSLRENSKMINQKTVESVLTGIGDLKDRIGVMITSAKLNGNTKDLLGDILHSHQKELDELAIELKKAANDPEKLDGVAKKIRIALTDFRRVTHSQNIDKFVSTIDKKATTLAATRASLEKTLNKSWMRFVVGAGTATFIDLAGGLFYYKDAGDEYDDMPLGQDEFILNSSVKASDICRQILATDTNKKTISKRLNLISCTANILKKQDSESSVSETPTPTSSSTQ